MVGIEDRAGRADDDAREDRDSCAGTTPFLPYDTFLRSDGSNGPNGAKHLQGAAAPRGLSNDRPPPGSARRSTLGPWQLGPSQEPDENGDECHHRHGAFSDRQVEEDHQVTPSRHDRHRLPVQRGIVVAPPPHPKSISSLDELRRVCAPSDEPEEADWSPTCSADVAGSAWAPRRPGSFRYSASTTTSSRLRTWASFFPGRRRPRPRRPGRRGAGRNGAPRSTST